MRLPILRLDRLRDGLTHLNEDTAWDLSSQEGLTVCMENGWCTLRSANGSNAKGDQGVST